MNGRPMSDFPENDGPDPLDKAYREAEALLDDAEARAARRARVLGAVAEQPAAPAYPPPAAAGRRWGGWLAAASVVGLSLLTLSQIYRPGAPVGCRTALSCIGRTSLTRSVSSAWSLRSGRS